jgi:hypothetical protein
MCWEHQVLASVTPTNALRFSICGHVGNGTRFGAIRAFKKSLLGPSRKQLANSAKWPRTHSALKFEFSDFQFFVFRLFEQEMLNVEIRPRV